MANRFHPPATSPTAYGYSRVSHSDSFLKGDSLPSQELRIKQYYETHLKPQGIALGGIENDGTNVSAYKVMFHVRPAGRRLLEQMKPGDHLIVDKVDRFWRSLKDFIHLMELFEKKNITVHIVNFLGQSVQNNTPMGDFILKQFVMIAELESTIKSERIAEALHVKRISGLRIGSAVPPGCRLERTKCNTNQRGYYETLKWCEKRRTIMAEITRLILEERLTWWKASSHIEAFIAQVEQREPRKILNNNKDLLFKWPRLFFYECAYRYLGIREPGQIPRKDVIYEAARQYKRVMINRRAKELGKYHQSIVPAISPEELLAMA